MKRNLIAFAVVLTSNFGFAGTVEDIPQEYITIETQDLQTKESKTYKLTVTDETAKFDVFDSGVKCKYKRNPPDSARGIKTIECSDPGDSKGTMASVVISFSCSSEYGREGHTLFVTRNKKTKSKLDQFFVIASCSSRKPQ